MTTAFRTLSVLQQLDAFRATAGGDNVYADPEVLSRYACEETEDLQFLPGVVMMPWTAEEVSAIRKIGNPCQMPVTPGCAGAGWNDTGLSTPTPLGGVVVTGAVEQQNRRTFRRVSGNNMLNTGKIFDNKFYTLKTKA